MKINFVICLASAGLAASAVFVSGCSSSSSSQSPDSVQEGKITSGMHDSLLTDITNLLQATKDFQAAAPTTTGRGWDVKGADATAVTNMKAAWIRARTAYEHVEGALAPLFPDIDNSIDSRYDDFLTQLTKTNGDSYLFDDVGVTGLHAIERILYVDVTPPNVVTFEKTLPGYVAAAFPATEQESSDFKNKLCAKLIADAQTLSDQWSPQKIDLGGAFQGLISLMNEQKEKVNKASTFEEESRYSQRTMADIRDNLSGTQAIYALFQGWITSKSDGAGTDSKIQGGFQQLTTLYAAVSGDAIPQPPSTWSAENPTPADLKTPFGQLYTGVHNAVDPSTDGTVVFEMNHAADLLGFPEFKEGQ